MTKPQEYELTYASASLVLSGKNLDPDEVTRKLGMIPSESFKRGDYRTDTEIWSRGFWELSSRNLGNIDMRDHIEWLIDQLIPHKQQLCEIVEDLSIKAWIRCYWVLPTDHETLSLPSDLVAKLAEIDLAIDFDFVVDAHILK